MTISNNKTNDYDFTAFEDAWSQSSIAVLDSMPGSRKTTATTEYIKRTQPKKILFVTPFLSEAEIELPDNKLRGMHFVYPENGKGGKVQHLGRLIEKGDKSSGELLHRICCTHSAFKSLSDHCIQQLGDYTVVIDEQLDIIQKIESVRWYSEQFLLGVGAVNDKHYSLNNPEKFKEQQEKEKIMFSENGWQSKDDAYVLHNLAYLKRLYQYSDGYWYDILNISLLSAAKRVLVLTHGFENSFMHAWLEMNAVAHSYVDKEKLGLLAEAGLKAQLLSNLEIITPTRIFQELNEEKDNEPLSKKHYKSLIVDPKKISELSSAINHIAKEKCKASNDNLFWTCHKIYKSFLTKHAPRLRGKIILKEQLELQDEQYDYTTSSDDESIAVDKSKIELDTWLPCNIKAINGFGHVSNCIYAMTLNPNPVVSNLLSSQSGLDKNKMTEAFQLNNLLQFIYRGSIRNDQHMKLCILPKKTQNLLTNFMQPSGTLQ